MENIPGGFMRAHLLAGLTLSFVVVACSDRNQPVGTRGIPGLSPSRQDALVRPEERRAVELAKTIPGLGGFFFDTSGNVIVAVKDVGGQPVTRAMLQPLFRQELSLPGKEKIPTSQLG